MKTIGNIKKSLLCINFIITSSLFIGCNNGNKSATADMSREPKQDTAGMAKDAKFLAKVALINMEEIRLGELAQQNSSMKEVKELGEMMQDDHQKAQAELTQLAAKKSMVLPTAMDAGAEADLKELSGKSGADFDKAYTQMMVNGHKDAIALFTYESTGATDADIRQWAANTIPTLQKHLDHATECLQKCNSM